MLKHEDTKRWFALSFEEGKPPAIQVSIWEPCVDRLSEISGMYQEIPEYRKVWGFKAFEPNLRKGFGFDGAMNTVGMNDGYLIIRAPLLPKQSTTTAVSMGILLGILKFYPFVLKDHFKEEALADRRYWQLMELESDVTSDANWHSAPLGGVIAPILADWVESVYKNRPRLEEVEEAMWIAWNAMSDFRVKKEKGSPNPYPHFSSRLGEKGSFFLSCLGNACDISTTDWWDRREGSGHDLGCHNLDTPVQQLSLLAGLAALHDIAAGEIDSRSPA